MKMRFVLPLFLVACLLLTVVLNWKPQLGRKLTSSLKRMNRQNVILIVVDALRADHLSCYGYKRKTSPNLDRFAEKAVVFERAYTHVPLTLPTFTTMFTSRFPHSHKVNSPFSEISTKAVTLAEILKQHGWQTAAVVGASNLDSTFGLDQGFEFYEDTFRHQHSSIMFQRKNKTGYQRRAEDVNKIVFDWMERRQKSKNFFLFVHYIDPHYPYSPPAPYDRAYSGGEDEKSKWIALYDGETLYVDSQIGQLLDYLEKSKLSEDTLVIITSDHGEGLGDHNYHFHGGKLYETDVRVPLLFIGPNVNGGRRIKSLYQHIDLAPTILAYLNLTIPFSFQGISHLKLLQGKAAKEREYVLLEKGENKKSNVNMWAVRGAREKFIWSSDGNHEFYDLEEDPNELNNLFRKKNQRALDLFGSGFLFRCQFSADPLVIDKKTDRNEDLEENLKALGYVQ